MNRTENACAPVVVVADPLAPAAEDLLRRDAVVLRPDGGGRDGLLRALDGADALIVRSATEVDREVFAAARGLKVVGRAGVGVDNIDLAAAGEHGVTVVNTPTANIHSACEHAIALLLAAARNIPRADASTHAGRWERAQLQGVELYGKTVGVVGFGRVGQLFAERMLAFGTEVIATDPQPDRAAAERLGVRMVGLEQLVEQADFVSIHTPKVAGTHGLFDAALLARAKPGQILVNAARGGIVDEHALAEALRRGPIRAAGIDVFEEEPPADSPLFGVENVVLTPHLGASTSEAQLRAGVDVVRAVLGALRGERVPGVVRA